MAPKAVFFDFMGTCLDWHASVVDALSSEIPQNAKSKLAIDWRHEYFQENFRRIRDQSSPEDIDITLDKTLTIVLRRDHQDLAALITSDARSKVIEAWHSMQAWPDVAPAIRSLRTSGYEVFVHANGSTRLQLNLCQSSGLQFDMLFSSNMLGVYKPSIESYQKALELVQLDADEVIMVACHAYDLRGAKAAGMRTVYITRWTDDVTEDMEVVKGENNAFLEDMGSLKDTIVSL